MFQILSVLPSATWNCIFLDPSNKKAKYCLILLHAKVCATFKFAWELYERLLIIFQCTCECNNMVYCVQTSQADLQKKKKNPARILYCAALLFCPLLWELLSLIVPPPVVADILVCIYPQWVSVPLIFTCVQTSPLKSCHKGKNIMLIEWFV